MVFFNRRVQIDDKSLKSQIQYSHGLFLLMISNEMCRRIGEIFGTFSKNGHLMIKARVMLLIQLCFVGITITGL